MSEYELLFWWLIASLALFALVLWVIKKIEDRKKAKSLTKRLAQTNREADALPAKARSSLRSSRTAETKWGDL